MNWIYLVEITWLLMFTVGILGIHLWTRRIFRLLGLTASVVRSELGNPRSIEHLDRNGRRRWRQYLSREEYRDECSQAL
jgi:hypothetical protein